MYWPFAAAGFALMIAPISVSKFSCSFSAPKEALPIGQWMMLVLSRRYSILPAFASVTARGNVRGNGASLRVRHQAAQDRGSYRDGRQRPSCPGVAITTSKSIQPSALDLLHQVLCTDDSQRRPRSSLCQPCRPCRMRERGRSYRCRWAERWHRGPAGQRDGSQRPGVTWSFDGLIELSLGGLDRQWPALQPDRTAWMRSISFALSTYFLPCFI